MVVFFLNIYYNIYTAVVKAKKLTKNGKITGFCNKSNIHCNKKQSNVTVVLQNSKTLAFTKTL